MEEMGWVQVTCAKGIVLNREPHTANAADFLSALIKMQLSVFCDWPLFQLTTLRSIKG